jgi:sec-independent protein translocase protein TatA
MNIASFGNFLGPDTLIIFLIILLLFGAKKLPELARGLGSAVREFSKAKDDFHNEITRPVEEPPKQAPRAIEELKIEVAKDSHPHDEHGDYAHDLHDEHVVHAEHAREQEKEQERSASHS